MDRLDDPTLLALLADDVPMGDLTTRSLDIGDMAGHLVMTARHAMTVCGTEEAQRLFELAGARATITLPTGTPARPGDRLLAADGQAQALHRAWKTAQNLIEWTSGLATATAAMVAAAGGTPVACTRKTVPGAKALSVKAVLAGGGVMHRLGLSETLLVFSEHRCFLSEMPVETVARLRHAEPEKTIVVEVGSTDEALRWAHAGVDVLQVEKFSVEELARCHEILSTLPSGRRPRLAAAGGVNAGNAEAYVAAGADLLVTSAPYTAPPRDVQVTFGRV